MTDPAPTPTLPASAYLDEAVWEAEVRDVFRTGWVPVCRVDELVTVADRTYPSAWNWKVMVENWIECYHHLGSHRATVETRNPARTTRITETDAPWTFMTVDTSPEARTPPEGHAFPMDPADARHLTIWGVFPFLLGGTEADVSFWLEVTPRTVDGHQVTWHLLTSPANAERWEDGMAEAIMDALDIVHQEDMAQCARVDEGLRSGALITGRLVELEAPIAHFHRWLTGRLEGPRTSPD